MILVLLSLSISWFGIWQSVYPQRILATFSDNHSPRILIRISPFLVSKNCKIPSQRFDKLISNDRIWPSEHGFEVIFEKSHFVFEISAFKSGTSALSILGFTRFPKTIIGTFACDVTCDQSSLLSTQRSNLRDDKASGNCRLSSELPFTALRLSWR